jgi:hypothetical protein
MPSVTLEQRATEEAPDQLVEASKAIYDELLYKLNEKQHQDSMALGLRFSKMIGERFEQALGSEFEKSFAGVFHKLLSSEAQKHFEAESQRVDSIHRKALDLTIARYERAQELGEQKMLTQVKAMERQQVLERQHHAKALLDLEQRHKNHQAYLEKQLSLVTEKANFLESAFQASMVQIQKLLEGLKAPVPVVQVNVPEQAVPVVNLNTPAMVKTFTYDDHGRPAQVIETPVKG